MSTYQKSLVLNQKYRLHDSVHRANITLSNRAGGFLQAGSIIIGLVTVFSLPTAINTSNAFVALVYLLFLAMIILTVQANGPRPRQAAGSTDWDVTFNEYLYKDEDECFDKVLSDLYLAIDSEKDLNEYKARRVSWLGYLLITQIVFLILAISLG